MAASTRTNRTPARTSRAGGAGQSRFARSGSSTRPTRSPGIARTSSSSRTPGLRRRRQQQPSGMKKVLGAVLPTGAAKKATPSSKKGKAGAGGLALVAAAAGMALKNRDKLSQLRQKGSGTQPDTSFDTGMNNSPVSPTTPPA